MQKEQPSTEHLLLEIASLRRELEGLKNKKADLEILLETTTEHSDMVEAQLHQSNQQLQAEIAERQRTEEALQASQAALQSLLTIVTRDKTDLEILLETTTEHSDTVEAELHNKAEEAVRASERRLAQFLEAVPVGVFVIDASGKPYYANHTAQRLLGKGIAPEDTTAQLPEVYQAYVAGTDRLYPTARQPLMLALSGSCSTVDDMEVHQADKIIPIEVWATPIFDEKGKIVYAIAAFQDITQRKQAEAERINLINQLYQLNIAYERFVPREFLQFLKKESIVDVTLGDQVQQEMSVLFADIRDFTALSEKMTPSDNFQFINAFLSRMEPAITKHNGFIDKYIGDGIMALFSGGADDAIKAAITMLHNLAEYNQHRAQAGYPPIQIGIGINTGSLMLGTVGGNNRMQGTVISDAVNLASRIEGLTKEYGVSLLISHQTFLQLQNSSDYFIRIIDRVKIKGKSEEVTVYEVFDGDLAELKNGKLTAKTIFEKALLFYKNQKISEAAQLFQDCLYHNPMDKVAKIYLERCQFVSTTFRISGE